MARKAPQYAGANSGAAVKELTVPALNGGLNLGKSPIQLGQSESPDALNVDFLPFGGVARRKAIGLGPRDVQATVFAGMATFEQASSTQVMYGTLSGGNVSLYEYSSTAPKDIFTSDRIQGATLKGALYLACGHSAASRKWDGTVATQLNSNYADNPLALPHGSMPRGKYLCVHKGSLFIANLPGEPSAIRWSWPNEPEDWPTWAKEFVDSGAEGDEIVALVPHHERLLIFKRNSVYAIRGEGPNNFYLDVLAQGIGASSPEAVCRTDDSVWFYDFPNGVYRIGPTGPPEVTSFEKIRPAVPTTSVGGSTALVSWANRKLYVSLPWAGSTKNARTFVFEPTSEAWTAHDFGITSMVQVIPAVGADYSVGVIEYPGTSVGRLGILDQAGDYDWASISIVGTFQTAWWSAGDLMLQKRWRKARAILDGNANLSMSVRFDYDATDVSTIALAVPSSANIRFDKTRSAGIGRALSAKFRNTTPGYWHLSAFQLTFLEKRRRD